MTENNEKDFMYKQIERLITQYEQSRDPEATKIGQQFAQLQRTMIYAKENYPSDVGAQPMNLLKNRYKDVLPYDQYRVILSIENDSDYINASFIQDFDNINRYIAAQGPMDESITDFIRMIWEFQITSIVCTANEIEAGRFKFRRYWPDDEDFLQFGCYRIMKDETSDKEFHCEYYEIRPLVIVQGENRRHVILYHFLDWPDHDTPNEEAPILELLLRLYNDRSISPNTPILVHCSAGCGRTGSIIAIDLCRLLLHDEAYCIRKENQPSLIFEIAAHIRQFRIALIQTLKQYLFVHKMVLFIMKQNGFISEPSNTAQDEKSNLNSSSRKNSIPPSINSPNLNRPTEVTPIKLSNPPAGRRFTHRTNNSNNNNNNQPTSVLSSSIATKPNDKLAKSELVPPPIPPRQSLMNATNKRLETQFVHSGEVPIKTKRNLCRSRHVKRREPPPPPETNFKTTRSDSVDALYVSSSAEQNFQNSVNKYQNRSEQETNSD